MRIHRGRIKYPAAELSVALSVALSVVASESRAQTPLRAQLPAEVRSELSTAHFRTGMRYFDAARFAEAAVEFERVYEFSAQSEILYNIARAYEGARNYRRSVESYERVLSAAPQGIDLLLIRQDIARLRPLITQPAVATAATAGCADISIGNTSVIVQGNATPSLPSSPSSPPPLLLLRTRRVFERSALHEVGPWLILGVGVGLGGVAIWQGLAALDHTAMIDRANRGQAPWTIAVDQSFASVGLESALAIGLVAVAGVSLVGGSVWLVARGRGQARDIVVSARSTGTSAALVIGGVF